MNVRPAIALDLDERQVVFLGGVTIILDFIRHADGVHHLYVDIDDAGLNPITVCVNDVEVYE